VEKSSVRARILDHRWDREANGARGWRAAVYGAGGRQRRDDRLSMGALAGAGLLSANGAPAGRERPRRAGGGGGRISFIGSYPGSVSVSGGISGGSAQNGFTGTIGSRPRPVTMLLIDGYAVSGGSFTITSTNTLSLSATDAVSRVATRIT